MIFHLLRTRLSPSLFVMIVVTLVSSCTKDSASDSFTDSSIDGPVSGPNDAGQNDPANSAQNGKDGTNGIDGKDGKDGNNGIDGKDGKDGLNGADGKDGKDGVNGTNGTDGVNGVNGTNGAAGLNGTNGINGTNGNNGADGKDGQSFPDDISLDGVGSVDFYQTKSGLVMQTRATPNNQSGLYNGNGKGNKAFVGFTKFNGVSVADLKGVKIQARLMKGSQKLFYMNLLVDCNGDDNFNGSDAVVVVETNDFKLEKESKTIEFSFSDPIFKSVGGHCNLPSSNGNIGAPLSDLPAGAKLINAITADNGMPKGTELAGVLLILGDSANLSPLTVMVENVEISGNGYNFSGN